MSNKQKLYERKIFQLQSMSITITWIYNVCCQEFWYILSGLDIWPDQSDKDNPVWKKLGSRLQCKTWHIPLFQSINANSRRSGEGESWWVRLHGFHSSRALKLPAATRPFVWHWAWACQCTDTWCHAPFYIAVFSIIFFFDFVSGDLALTGFNS